MAKSTRSKAASASHREVKRRTQNLKTPAIAISIADAVAVKNGDIFLLTQADGTVPFVPGHGFGLYYHDCRFLSGYDLKLAGTRPNVLFANTLEGFRAVLHLTNPGLQLDTPEMIDEQALGIQWQRVIAQASNALVEIITITNHGLKDAVFPLELSFEADFKDLFNVRGLVGEQRGIRHPARWKDGVLHFTYDGADGLHRGLTIQFSELPSRHRAGEVAFEIALAPHESREIVVGMRLRESHTAEDVNAAPEPLPVMSAINTALEAMNARAHAEGGHSRSDNALLNRMLERGMVDLQTLRSHIGEDEYFAAGVPWYVALFGRDSLITAYHTLLFAHKFAEDTLRLLARFQGTRIDTWREEQPGKILHELRMGELANMNLVPHTPFYGSVDGTPLFLVLLAAHARRTGRLDLFTELKDHVDRALAWIDEHGDQDGDGYTDYGSDTPQGRINHCWKDSPDSIVNADGTLATPPLALVEVQGYVYQAKSEIAELFERTGDTARAERLRREAEDLKLRFNRDYWLPKLKFYALSLQAGGKPAAVFSSNPGHALWSGIVDEDKAPHVAEALMREDMFCGWGVRTLSEREVRFNPVGYHLGTVWPHDNAFIAAGLRRYGFHEEAGRIIAGLFAAASYFPNYRLPEVFAGFPMAQLARPVNYPVACNPQAWATGALPYMLQTLLGLRVDGFARRLVVTRPMLPPGTTFYELHDLDLGDAKVSLRFEAGPAGAQVSLLEKQGDYEVIVELG